MPTGSFQQYVVGASLFFVAILTGIVMSWAGGMLIDGFYANHLYNQTLVPQSLITYAQGPVYNEMTAANMGTVGYYVNLFYALCYGLPIIGCFLLWQSLVKYQSAEYYGSMFASAADNEGPSRRRHRRRR